MLALGVILLLFTIGVAIAIGYRANESVRHFDESAHESFIGSQAEREGYGWLFELCDLIFDYLYFDRCSILVWARITLWRFWHDGLRMDLGRVIRHPDRSIDV